MLRPVEWHNIKVAGYSFTIASGRDKRQVASIEDKVNSLFQEISSDTNESDIVQLLILCAFNLADELIDAEQGLSYHQQNKIKELIELLDDKVDSQS